MTLTINTDASFHPDYKVGAFAFWIVCNDGKIVHSGPLKKVLNSQDAELQAIANALYTVLNTRFSQITHIYINTDCKFGIRAVTEGKMMSGCKETVEAIHKYIQQLKEKHGFVDKSGGRKVEFVSWRHIRAHTNGNTKRTWVNNKMDELAKEALWKSINKNKKRKH